MKEKYDIFISYRREGGYDTAKHLNDLLVRDGYRVSFDIDTLRNGDFDVQLYERIDQCKDFILIVDQHAFDRCLESNSVPKNDWLRCELAYALQKNKNIIPIFLSGVKGFPLNLPEDIAKVKVKNGPEYNRYHFNAFYKDLKKRFLISRSYKPFILLPIVLLVVLLLIGGLYLLRNNGSKHLQNITTDIEDCTPIEYPIFSAIEAREIATNVMMQRPFVACGYNNEKTRVVAIFNKIKEDDPYPNYSCAWDPQVQIATFIKEGGVWHLERKFGLNMEQFYKMDADDVYRDFGFDDNCTVFKLNSQEYLYFKCSRTNGAHIYSEIYNDYVAINLSTEEYSHLIYIEEIGGIVHKGELLKEQIYPCGIEEYLLNKLENDSSVSKMSENVSSEDVENIRREWFLDNPKNNGYMENIDYDEEHRANVRMYNSRPDSADYADCQNMYTIYDIGNYKVYNRWRGDVYAYDKKEKKYFLVWTDLLNYNDKTIKNLGNNDIFIIYSDFGDVGDTVDAVIYNLENHSYIITKYYVKESLRKD